MPRLRRFPAAREAFRFAAKQVDPQTVEVRFDVADGYYMYRERFAFATQPATVKLGPPVLPQGQVNFDETFGKNMETYRGSVVVRVPVRPGPRRWPLVAGRDLAGLRGQGLCYPPMESIYKVGGSVLGNLFGDRDRARYAGAGSARPACRIRSRCRRSQPGPPRAADDNDRIAGALASRNLGLIAALFFGLGPAADLHAVRAADGAHPVVDRRGRACDARSRRCWSRWPTCSAWPWSTPPWAWRPASLGEGLAAALQNPWVLGAFAALMVAGWRCRCSASTNCSCPSAGRPGSRQSSNQRQRRADLRRGRHGRRSPR